VNLTFLYSYSILQSVTSFVTPKLERGKLITQAEKATKGNMVENEWQANVYVDAATRHDRMHLSYQLQFSDLNSVLVILRCHEIVAQTIRYCDGMIAKPEKTKVPPLLQKASHELLVEAYMAAGYMDVIIGWQGGKARVIIDFAMPNDRGGGSLGCKFVFRVDRWGHVEHTMPQVWDGNTRSVSWPPNRFTWTVPPFVTQKIAA